MYTNEKPGQSHPGANGNHAVRGYATTASGTRQSIYDKPDILSVVAPVVPLKGNGPRRWGVCPFHADKSPSFCVYIESQTFFCFGCNAHGDVITFIRKFYKLTFRDALIHLGIRPGAPPKINQEVERQRIIERRYRTALEDCYDKLCVESRALLGEIRRANAAGDVWTVAEAKGSLADLDYRFEILLNGASDERAELLGEVNHV